MPGSKTHEQQIRMFENKPDLPADGVPTPQAEASEPRPHHPEARQSEMPVSRGGMNQESRQHNKPRQDG